MISFCASMNLREILHLLSKFSAFNHGERAARVQSPVNGQTQFSCEAAFAAGVKHEFNAKFHRAG